MRTCVLTVMKLRAGLAFGVRVRVRVRVNVRVGTHTKVIFVL